MSRLCAKRARTVPALRSRGRSGSPTMFERFAHFGVRLAAVVALAAPLPLAAQSCPDCLFSQSFENEFFLPANDAEAARFLNQATFGAQRADISYVRNNGFEA